MRILIVDDDDCIRTLLGEILTATGYHDVTSAESAKEALEKIAEPEAKYDFFLVDIQMPQVDGVALIEMIRSTPGYALAPIVMLTAMHDRSYIDRAFKAGATDYVTKPFDYVELRQRIQSAQTLAYENERGKDQGLRPSDYVGAIARNRDTPENPLVLGQRREFLGYGEFDNYILQLARRRLNKTYVYSVNLSNLATLASRSDPDDFIRSLKTATKRIQEFFVPFGGIGSYRGKGTFLFVTTKRTGLPREAMEAELNTLLEGAFPGGGTLSPRLVVGAQMALDTGSDERALSTLRQSVEDVERRQVPEEVTKTVTTRLLRSRWFSDEQRRLEQRTYKSVLQTLMADEPLDDWSRQIRQKRL